MKAQNRLSAPTAIQMPTWNRRVTEAPRGGTKMAGPQPSHRTGAVRRSTGGDGDGGFATIKRNAVPLTTSMNTSLRGVEKPTIASTLRAASNRSKVLETKAASNRKERSTYCDQKLTQAEMFLNLRTRERPQRRAAGRDNLLKKDSPTEAQSAPGIEKQPLVETGIQTNEREILNRDLLVGDIKILMTSPELAKQIDNDRSESMKKLNCPKIRKFSKHEHKEEQHLDELKEFMERNYVTKRAPKKPSPLAALAKYESDQSCSIFKSMDEFFKRDIPKAESITNIKERIKRKEVELMSMFENVTLNEKIESESEGG